MGVVALAPPEGTTPTFDASVCIEDRRPGYIRYVQTSGRRWEVFGECVKLGYCMVGGIFDGVKLLTLDDAIGFIETHPFDLDVPITPQFSGCCPFTFNELEPTEPFTT
jgi:hypothetical protein